MPFIAKHVRLTNSGKIPDLFLTSKVQAPADLADAQLGKLYFVIQIDSPWNHASPIGSSIINVIGREYYRQVGRVPLENFERAIAKANRLIEQLIKEGEHQLPTTFHALVGLSVGDELHIAYAGEAEAHFLRDNKLNRITIPRKAGVEQKQIFDNLITGEISANDVVLLGSPYLFGALTTEELGQIIEQPLGEAGLTLARRLRSIKFRKANALLIHFTTLQAAENNPIAPARETIYLDQPIDSAWSVALYYATLAIKPIVNGGKTVAKKSFKAGHGLAIRLGNWWQNTLIPKTGLLIDKGKSRLRKTKTSLPKTEETFETDEIITDHQPPTGLSSKLPPLGLQARQLANKLRGVGETLESGVPVNHYSKTKKGALTLQLAFSVPYRVLVPLGKQFRKAVKRSPRTWYAIIALLILASIGASVQTRQQQNNRLPVATAATVEEIKKVVDEAKKAKVRGDNSKARQLFSNAMKLGQNTENKSKYGQQVSSIANAAEKDLLALSGASQLSAVKPILTLPEETSIAAIYDGIFYYLDNEGRLNSLPVTGGEPTALAELPGGQAANQLYLNSAEERIYLQTYDGDLHLYDIKQETLAVAQVAGGDFPVSTGLNSFGETLYLLDPAEGEIWKYVKEGEKFGEKSPYLRGTRPEMADSIGLSIDGAVFVLHRNGSVNKFTRGNLTEFKLNGLPAPYDKIVKAHNFSAAEGGDRYYMSDLGDDQNNPRIIEFDRNGKFVHQYFLPAKWRKKIKVVITSPTSKKAWLVVEKELYEFTLIQQ